VTALISPPKAGKTTLLSHVLARFNQGGQLAGLAVAPGRALVVSEEAASDWGARCRRLALGQHHSCRIAEDSAFFGIWCRILVVFDTLAKLLPGYAETCAPKMLDCLLPLQALANLGPAVWLLYHPAKGKPADGQAARGSGALTGFADVILELSCYRRARNRDWRRRICAYSRYVETPRHLILEPSLQSASVWRTNGTSLRRK